MRSNCCKRKEGDQGEVSEKTEKKEKIGRK